MVYQISCRICESKYIGETSQTLRARINGHKDSIRREKNTLLYKHFRKDEEHRNRTIEELLEIQIVEKIYDLDKEEQLDKKFTERRLMREYYWMVTLFTVYPYGLNDKVKGFGSVWSNEEANKNFNHHQAFRSIHVLIPKTRKRKRRLVTSGSFRDKTNNFFLEIGNSGNIGNTRLRYLLQSQSKRVLNTIVRDNRFNNVPQIIRLMLNKWRDNQLKEKIGHLFLKNTDIRKRMFMKIRFENKWLEKVQFNSIFRKKEVKEQIPSSCQHLDPPIILYTYGRNIGSFILNYSKELKELNIESFSDIEEMNCNCSQSTFCNPQFNHVVTGDLSIVGNLELRNLMSKGTKFRESPNPNFEKINNQIVQVIDEYVDKWSNKERLDPDCFLSWKNKVKQLIKEKLVKLKAKCRRYEQTGEILKKPEVRPFLEELQKKFVFCVVDKASNNFAIVCKKFYLLNQGKELGLDSGRYGNDTYTRTRDSEEVLCSRLKEEMSRLFQITIPEQNLKLPILHWIPKFHKNPIKFRFIAGSRDKVLTVLESEVQKILNLLESHFRNYCEVIRQNSGYRYYFAINNSRQALEMLKGVEEPTSFDSYDFSNLYTNFKHDELIDKFKFLLDLLFTNTGRKNKGDCIRTEKNSKGIARWSVFNEENLNKYRGQLFWTKYKILEAIEFLIRNAHIKFGNLIFRQICGIPMGMIPAPGFAKLGLGVDEFLYCSKLLKDKKTNILRKLINMVRYIDDIGVANFLDFGNIAKDIYPRSLILNKSNNSSILNSSFLDLNVSVCDNEFVTKVYNKIDDYDFRVITFPFLESNIVTTVCYSVFFGEVLRYLRICSKLGDFESRAKMLVVMLVQRGYKRSELAKQFIKVFFRYKLEVRKYPGCLNPADSMQRVVFYPLT